MREYSNNLSHYKQLKNDDHTPYLDLLESQDLIPYDDQIMKKLLNEKVDQMLEDLSEREATILKMRFGFFGEVKTLEDIGREIGISRERVRQIERRAKERLKSRLQNETWENEGE